MPSSDLLSNSGSQTSSFLKEKAERAVTDPPKWWSKNKPHWHPVQVHATKRQKYGQDKDVNEIK